MMHSSRSELEKKNTTFLGFYWVSAPEIWTFLMSELAKCMSALIFVFSTVGPWITGLGLAYLVTQILRTLSGARASGILIMAAN